MIEDILSRTYMQNTIEDYLRFIGIFLAGVLVLQIIKWAVLHRLKAWSAKTSTTIDDFLVRIIEKKLIPITYFGAFYLSSGILVLTPFVQKIINVTGIILFTIFGISLLVEVVNYSLETYWVKKESDPNRQRSLKGIITVIKTVIWAIGVAFLLDNLGFKVSAVVAGLGIGGIAVALAAQAVLGDLFSYFTIFFDRPFEIGDFIIIGDFKGTIEHVGIKSTRIRSLGGEQLVFSNTDLTNSRIRNYKRMEKRRVVFSLGVTYQTSLENIKLIPDIIKESIENTKETVFDRAHFSSYGDFSLVFEVVYYVLSSDYNIYMDIQQEINFSIMKKFKEHGIEFAYPTQTLFVEKTTN